MSYEAIPSFSVLHVQSSVIPPGPLSWLALWETFKDENFHEFCSWSSIHKSFLHLKILGHAVIQFC